MALRDRITIQQDKRGGHPCVRGMRVTVGDVLGYFAAGMTRETILTDFPYLQGEDLDACLQYAAAREDGEEWFATT